MRNPTLIIFTLLFASCSMIPKKLRPVGEQRVDDPFFVSWTKALDPVYETGNLPISLNSPVVHKGVLYLGNARGRMNAYNLQNGRVLWSAVDKSGYHAGAEIVEDHLVYGDMEGRLYSRSLIDGKISYEVDLGASVETRPTYAKGRIFVQTRNHKIFCIDAKTGKILWAYRRSVPFLTTLQRVSRPLVQNNKVYVGFADGTVLSFSVEEGVVLWEQRIVTGQKFVDVDTEPVFFKGKLVVGSLTGDLVIIDPQYGNVLRRLPYKVARRPYLMGKNLLVSTAGGELVLIDEFLQEKKRVKLADEAISSVVQWKSNLAVSTVGREIYHVSKEDFSILKRFELGSSFSAIFGSLHQADGRLAAFSSRNRLYVFK